MTKPQFTVLRDTAEHENKGWIFTPTDTCLGTTERNLFTGDYSLDGYYDNKLLIIERKGNVAEFAGNLTQKDKWRNFKDELERMEEFRWPFLILEFPFSAIKSFPVDSGIPRSRWSTLRVTPQFLRLRLAQIQLHFKTKILFAGENGKDVASDIFKRVIEQDV